MKEHPFNFKLVSLPKKEIQQKLDFGYPTTIIVDKNGRVVFVESGGPVEEKEAYRAVREKLKPKLDLALGKK